MKQKSRMTLFCGYVRSKGLDPKTITKSELDQLSEEFFAHFGPGSLHVWYLKYGDEGFKRLFLALR